MGKQQAVISPATRKALQDEYTQYMFEVEGVVKFGDVPEVSDNPFRYKSIESFEMKRKVIGAVNGVTSVYIVDKETGKIVSGATENRVFVKKEYVDNAKFIKIYQHRMKELFNMSHPAIKVMGYFMHEMQKPEYIRMDMIYLDKDACMEFCGYSVHNMLYKGLMELVKKGFIAKSDKPGYYFVDSNTSFNGNRIVIMEEYEKKEQSYFNK